MYRFEVKCKAKTPNDVKLSALQNGYLRFLIFSILNPKIQNVDSSKIKANKLQNFGVVQKSKYVL